MVPVSPATGYSDSVIELDESIPEDVDNLFLARGSCSVVVEDGGGGDDR